MNKISRVFILTTFCCSLFFAATHSCADILYTNDERELRGIVTEDYKDRVVMSTVDGEVAILKSNIKQLYYDGEADNLVKLAEQSRERGDVVKSFAYYDMALRADPDSKSARDGIVFLQGYLFRKEQVKKEDEIRKQEEFENFGAAKIMEEKPQEETIKDLSASMSKLIGIVLVDNDGGQVVSSVRPGSPAADAGIKKKDTIVAVWGRLTGYMPPEDVMRLLLEKPSLEIKCTIERDVIVQLDPNRTMMSSLRDVIGASFAMLFDGLTVSEVIGDGPANVAGLQKGDIIVAINGKSTRYMPLKKAMAIMGGVENNSILFKLRRELSIWRTM